MKNNTNAKLIKEDGRVFIESAPKLGWGTGKENTFMGALYSTLNSIGDEVTYEYLMGISGAAFRLHFHPVWCPSSPDATCGFDTSTVAFNALGYDTEALFVDANDKSLKEKMMEKIIPSIDDGVPVIAIDLIKVPDWGVITGYTNNGDELLCRTYYDNPDLDEYSIAEKTPWSIFVIKKNNGRKDEKEVIMNSLKLAIALSKTESFEKYISGFAAYEYWIDGLLNETLYKDYSKAKEKIQPNAWIYYSLLDSRKAAIRYLISIRNKISIKELDKIIGNYRKVVELLFDNLKYVPFPWQLEDKQWNGEMRKQQAETLKEILSVEKEIVGLIENAIDNINLKPE